MKKFLEFIRQMFKTKCPICKSYDIEKRTETDKNKCNCKNNTSTGFYKMHKCNNCSWEWKHLCKFSSIINIDK